MPLETRAWDSETEIVSPNLSTNQVTPETHSAVESKEPIGIACTIVTNHRRNWSRNYIFSRRLVYPMFFLPIWIQNSRFSNKESRINAIPWKITGFSTDAIDYVSPMKARFDIKIKITTASHIRSRILLFQDLYDLIRTFFPFHIAHTSLRLIIVVIYDRVRVFRIIIYLGTAFREYRVGVRLDDLWPSVLSQILPLARNIRSRRA